MSGTFDPYHRWLGISPKDRPASYYRLLGIELFESDPEVIRDAAERQMAHVRTYQLGPYVDLSQRILNELAAAKACLLDAGKKNAYDALLKKRQSQSLQSKVAQGDVYKLAEPIPTTPNVNIPQLSAQPKRAFSSSAETTPLTWRDWPIFQGKWWLQLAGVVVGGILVLTIVGFYGKLWTTSTTLKPRQTASRRIEPEKPVAENKADIAPAVPSKPVLLKPPRLAKIADQTVDVGTKTEVQVAIADQGTAEGQLIYRLGPGTPAGASIDSNSGLLTWTPNRPGKYPFQVLASAADNSTLSDKMDFLIVVRNVEQLSDSMVRKTTLQRSPALTTIPPPKIDASTDSVSSQPFMEQPQPAQPTKTCQLIELPSGTVFDPSKVNLLTQVRAEIGDLMGQCRAGNPNAIGFFQEGSSVLIDVVGNVKGKKPHGTAVFFHPSGNFLALMPKHYVNYRNGRWDGVLASWDASGLQHFWGNYSNAKREGLFCLWNGNSISSVLEYADDKLVALHTLTANQISKTWANDEEAAADPAAALLLKQLDALEDDIRTEDRSYCERIRKGIQTKIGALNMQKRAAASARSSNRAAAQEQQIKNLKRAGGW